MRYTRLLVTVLLAFVVVAGCSSSERASRRRLTEQIDLARRRYNHATALLANPQYIEKATGRRSPIPHKLMNVREVDVPTIRPTDNPKAEELLEKAAGIVTEALSANPEAPVGAKADAQHLLGEIQLAMGRYHCTGAEQVRNEAEGLRLRARNLLALARSNAIQAEFSHKLANLPRKDIDALRDETAKQLTGLDARIADIDKEISSKEESNTALSKQNEKILVKARSLRDRREVTGGSKGLELLKEVQSLEAEVNSNASVVAANQQAIDILKFERARRQQQRQGTDLRSAVIRKHLEGMDSSALNVMDQAKTARQWASKNQQEAETIAGRIVKCCGDLTGREKLAVAALESAVEHLGKAENALRKEIGAAKAVMGREEKPSEIVEEMSDSQHLSMVIAVKGSASLALGDLRSRQIATAKANAALGNDVVKVSKQLDRPAPPVAESLKDYLPDVAKTRAAAEENYKHAENDLEEIRSLRLKGDIAGNTAWICQAQLANAYLGHFRLTGEREVLNKAKQFVADALAGKEGSPYLEPVVELQRLCRE